MDGGFIAKEVSGWLMYLGLKFQLSRKNKRDSRNLMSFMEYKGVKDPPFLEVFVTGVLEDTGGSWMGFHDQKSI